jgi:uncharacterized protein YqeY
MSLVQKIDDDLKQAMKNKEAGLLSVLRMLKSAVKYATIEKSGADGVPTDNEVITVVRRELKKRHDSIESFTKAGRTDLAEKEAAEAKLLEAYLPAGLSEAELEAIVRAAIAETGATGKAQMGAVMKAAVAKAEGRADNRALSTLVQKLLP